MSEPKQTAKAPEAQKPTQDILDAVGKTFADKSAQSETRYLVHEFIGAIDFPRGVGLKWAYRIHRTNPAGAYLAPATDFLSTHVEVKGS